MSSVELIDRITLCITITQKGIFIAVGVDRAIVQRNHVTVTVFVLEPIARHTTEHTKATLHTRLVKTDIQEMPA